jgi:phosphopantothenoylcysteine decarboxylase/phosphopantothenate--cysteine ligase
MHYLITAGPTREAIDPVRYLSNRSSGKMGYAIAQAAAVAGHEVTLISGPTQLACPSEVKRVSVESAAEMYAAVQELLPAAQVGIFAAAVADYRPATVAEQKLKKLADTLVLHLEKTPDILGSVRRVFGFRGLLVGFAAETQNLEQYALEKLRKKGCDYLVANDVSRSDIGFDADSNEIRLFAADGSVDAWPKLSKAEVGQRLVKFFDATFEK